MLVRASFASCTAGTKYLNYAMQVLLSDNGAHRAGHLASILPGFHIIHLTPRHQEFECELVISSACIIL
jgi:hypothetical protein